jgi:predicted TIM-barrel fold metal-dependent hydrolase
MRTVAVEEHCLTPELREVLGEQIHPYYPAHRWRPALEARLADIGAGREYLTRNFYISISGLFSDPPLRCALDVIGPDRMLFAIDHPFGDNATGARFLGTAAVTDEERLKIAYQNADRLLGL